MDPWNRWLAVPAISYGVTGSPVVPMISSGGTLPPIGG
jgi:hypothetical protein